MTGIGGARLNGRYLLTLAVAGIAALVTFPVGVDWVVVLGLVLLGTGVRRSVVACGIVTGVGAALFPMSPVRSSAGPSRNRFGATPPRARTRTATSPPWKGSSACESVQPYGGRTRPLRVLLPDPPIDWSAVTGPEDLFALLARRNQTWSNVIIGEVLASGRRCVTVGGGPDLCDHVRCLGGRAELTTGPS